MANLSYRKCLHNFCKKPLFTVLNAKGLQTNIQKPKVLFEQVDSTGVITLNRPKLNLIDYSIVAQLYPVLQSWERTQSRVIIRSVGEDFSAGGDIKWLFSPKSDPTKYLWLSTGYNNYYRVFNYRIPFIALMDGIAMGAAFMLTAHARYKVVTERTVLSMPETRIGWTAAGQYYFQKLKNHLGVYFGLTGKCIKGKDAVFSGIATHFVPSARLKDLEAELYKCDVEDIEGCLNAYSEPLGEFSLAPNIADIDYCFSADTVEEIIERLLKIDTAWSKDTLEAMAPLCPIMLKVTLQGLKLGKELDIKDSLRMEYRVESRCIGTYNAQEGLRSVLFKRTNRPKWRPPTLAEVTDAEVNSYFEPLPKQEELRFYDDAQILHGWHNAPNIVY